MYAQGHPALRGDGAGFQSRAAGSPKHRVHAAAASPRGRGRLRRTKQTSDRLWLQVHIPAAARRRQHAEPHVLIILLDHDTARRSGRRS